MAEPVRDRATVTSAGEPLDPVPHGVVFCDVPTHVDERRHRPRPDA